MIKKIMVAVILAVMLLSLFVVGASADATVDKTIAGSERDKTLRTVYGTVNLDGYYQIDFVSMGENYFKKIVDGSMLFVALEGTYVQFRGGLAYKLSHIAAFTANENYSIDVYYYNENVTDLYSITVMLSNISDVTIYTSVYPLVVPSTTVATFLEKTIKVTYIGEERTLLASFGYILEDIIGMIGISTGLFYLNGSLTVIGMLTILAVSVGICFLIISVVRRFFQLRG